MDIEHENQNDFTLRILSFERIKKREKRQI